MEPHEAQAIAVDSRLLNNRPPTHVVDLEQSAEAQHESRHASDYVLRNGHRDQNQDSKTTIREFAHRRCSVAFSVHKFGEIVCPFSVVGLEGEINFPRSSENVA